MQSLTWYVRRLRGMSPEEIVWRLRSTGRDSADRYRVLLGRYPKPGSIDTERAAPAFRLIEMVPGAWTSEVAGSREASWRDRLERQAAPLLRNRLTYLGLDDVDLGSPVDWHRDHASGARAPRGFAPAIDYRDFSVTGDCKLVWEPNRHHHLVVLARAWRATGDERYARAVVENVESWIDGNPFGRGMNWRSPLELAIRLINWVWSFDLLDQTRMRPETRRAWMYSAYLHAWEIQRKFSRGSSANNHLIGEAAGVFIACSYFSSWPAAAEWVRRSQATLEAEIERQTYPDGCNREQALGYHLFVIQFFLLSGIVARQAGQDFSPRYWKRLEGMFAFLSALCEGGEHLPFYGDADDGYVLDLGDRQDEARMLLSVAAVVFQRPDLKSRARQCAEAVRWLLGPGGLQRFDGLASDAERRLGSCAFPDSGYYLLQSGFLDDPGRISVFADCGELGYQSIAAHGHADALSFTLRAFGAEVLVDPGTYDYFTHPAWREYFRSTRAHNTATVDGRDQSVMSGPFMWGARAVAQCASWDSSRATWEARHDGYTRLPDPVRHSRTIALLPERRELAITDRFDARGRHEYALWFHAAPECRVAQTGEGELELTVEGGSVRLRLDPALAVTLFHGSEQPIAGWVSRRYHVKQPSTTIRASASGAGQVTFASRIVIGAPSPR